MSVVVDKIRSLLGEDGLLEIDHHGIPVAVPANSEECALLLRTASSESWTARLEGLGEWIPRDAPADFALSTKRLRGVVDLSPPDLVATVGSGTSWTELQTALADEGMWVPHDPPGSQRSVGSVVACATAGPLRTGFGAIRDHLLGLTLVTGDGRVVRVGGRVVKNVAGYDLTKLAAGSFGAFGVITSVNLRLWAVPRADVTLITGGTRDRLLDAARSILSSGQTPAALELLSPTAVALPEWTLAIRLLGSDEAVSAERNAIGAAAEVQFSSLEPSHATEFWKATLVRATDAPVTLRLGALTSSLAEALDSIAHHLDEGCDDWIGANILTGVVRWSGNADINRLRLFRHVAAHREMPVTIERGPWLVRSELGHFGAYRDGLGRLVYALRRTFDPSHTLAIPLGRES
jgi:glycolate oxidase FAD binding subunit